LETVQSILIYAAFRRKGIHRQTLLRHDRSGTRQEYAGAAARIDVAEAEAIADYVLAKFAGRGAATRAECEESFGKDARACGEYPVKP